MQRSRRVLVVGATGGSGRAVVDQLLFAGHRVTALARSASTLPARDGLVTVDGDATDAALIDRLVRGHDAVVVTLGIRENPLRVRLFGSVRTRLDVRSAGTRNVIAAMRAHGVRRLVVQTSYGVGATRARLRLPERLLFGLLLRPQIADTELQEAVVRDSGVDWVLAQPVHLTDGEGVEMPFASAAGEVRAWQVARRSVARFLAQAVDGAAHVGHSVALSG